LARFLLFAGLRALCVLPVCVAFGPSVRGIHSVDFICMLRPCADLMAPYSQSIYLFMLAQTGGDRGGGKVEETM